MYPNSELFKFPPTVALVLTFTAYVFLAIFVVMRLFIKKRSSSAICRSISMCAIMLFSAGDLIWVSLDKSRTVTWVVPILNVALLLFFIRAIREIWIQFTKVLIKSVPVFIIILAYFLLFVLIGFILFGQNTDNLAFSTITSSMYTVFILFTVSNYPDVSMAYFENNRYTALYFWAYLLIGIFLLSNLLLAQIFINYKTMIDSRL